MEAMRQSWTDDRLDDLRGDLHEFRAETKAEFTGVRKEFAAVRNEMTIRAEVRDEFKDVRLEMKAGFDSLNARFDRMQRTIVAFSGLIIVALLGLIGTQL